MPRIRAELQDAGVTASHKRITRLMRQERMRGVSRRRSFCVTTERDVRHRPAPDLVNRMFVATDITQLWVADMTYLPTWTGFLECELIAWRSWKTKTEARLSVATADRSLVQPT